MATANPVQRTASKTVTDTIVGKLYMPLNLARCIGQVSSQLRFARRLAGEHTHTIVGYSLIKGIGDGEPIASERFMVGGHEWVSVSMPG